MKKILLALMIVAAFALPLSAQTTQTIKISALPGPDTAPSDNDLTITVDGSITKKTTWVLLFRSMLSSSAQLSSYLGNETGSSGGGVAVFSNSPVLTTPNIGNAVGNISGTAALATALAANGNNCPDGQAPLGIDAGGNAEGCYDIATQNELDAVTAGASNGWIDFGTTVALNTVTDSVGIGTSTASGTVEIVRTAGVAPFMVSSSATGDGNFLIVTSVGNVGVNTVSPGRPLEVATANNNGIRVVYTGSSSSTNSGRVVTSTNDGSAMALGDKLGEYTFAGFDGSGDLEEQSGIYSKAEETWTNSARGAGFYFDTTLNGQTTRTAKMVLSNAGLLGIGTTVPNSSVSIIRNSTNPYFKISSASAQTGDILLIPSSGNIGINTLTPLNALHVNADVRIGSGTFSQTTGNADLYVQGNIQAGIYYGDGSQLTGISGATGGGWTDGGANVYTTATTDFVGIGTTSPSTTFELVKQSSSAPLMISATPTGDGDYMLINSSGNVGIGSTAPSNKLEVGGTIAGQSVVGIGTTQGDFRLLERTANGSNYIQIVAPAAITSNVTCTLEDDSTPFDGCVTASGGGSSAAGWTDGGTNVYQTTTTDFVGIGTTSPSTTLEIVQQSTNPPLMISSTPTGDGNRLIVTSAGNVGIGTTTASNVLTVNGAAKFLGTGTTILAQGNVGIGTTSASSLLKVGSAGQFGIDSSGLVTFPAATAGRSLTINSTAIDADAELYTQTKCITIESPTNTDNFLFYRLPGAATITNINCIAESATSATIRIDECDTAGDNCAGIDGATTIVCDVDGQADDGSLSNSGVDATDWLRTVVTATSGTPGQVAVCATMTMND